MKCYIKQAIYLLLLAIIIGIVINYVRPEGLPYISKQEKDGISEQIYEYIIETIDIEIAKEYYFNNVQFVDARDNTAFEVGHIKGAIKSTPFITLTDDLFNNQGFDEPIVVYCDDDECGLSEELAYQLQAEGFSKIYVFSGGWNQWLIEKLPIEK